MTNGAIAATSGGPAAVAAIANAIRASDAIVRVESHDFEAILTGTEATLVVMAQGGVFTRNYQYLTSYKGLTFFTKTQTPLILSPKTELVNANKIWIPG